MTEAKAEPEVVALAAVVASVVAAEAPGGGSRGPKAVGVAVRARAAWRCVAAHWPLASGGAP